MTTMPASPQSRLTPLTPPCTAPPVMVHRIKWTNVTILFAVLLVCAIAATVASMSRTTESVFRVGSKPTPSHGATVANGTPAAVAGLGATPATAPPVVTAIVPVAADPALAAPAAPARAAVTAAAAAAPAAPTAAAARPRIAPAAARAATPAPAPTRTRPIARTAAVTGGGATTPAVAGVELEELLTELGIDLTAAQVADLKAQVGSVLTTAHMKELETALAGVLSSPEMAKLQASLTAAVGTQQLGASDADIQELLAGSGL